MIQLKLHIANVLKIAEAGRRAFSSRFASVSPELLNDFISTQHDAVKFMTAEELRELGYGFSESVIEILERHRGVDAANLPAPRRDEFLRFVDEFNRIEDGLKRRFFERRRVSSDAAADLLLLERVADVLDTRLSPARAEELGLSRPPSQAAEYFAHRGEVEAASLARVLEPRYAAIVSEAEFRDAPTSPLPRAAAQAGR